MLRLTSADGRNFADLYYGQDVREALKSLPDKSVHMIATSPPYFGLRDYGREGQLGAEESPEEYVRNLVEVMQEARRVLRDDGTLWLNLGDSYAVNGVYINAWTEKEDNQSRANLHTEHADRYMDRKAVRGGEWNIKAKDLMGIPWRVALALQQPYQASTCVKLEKDRAWLAAMFDGEGCIGIRRFDSYREEKKQIYQDGFVAYTSVTNNDIELLDHCVDLTGFGKPSLKQKAGNVDGRAIVSRRDSFGWRLDGNPAVSVIQAIYPYLIAKRKQACLAYTLDLLNKREKSPRVTPREIQEKKQMLWELIKQCNQRNPIDLPDWIKEPVQTPEPGWYLRSDIIWQKPDAMPEKVYDRPTKSHEYIFLLTKQAHYFYDRKGGQEPSQFKASGTLKRKGATERGCPYNGVYGNIPWKGTTRNRRSVWSITRQTYKGAHFATFPEGLVEIMIKCGSSGKGCCPHCGAPWQDSPTCECPEHEPVPCTVMDIFSGSATTGKVAWGLGRNYIGIDLNPDYLPLAQERLLDTPAQAFREPGTNPLGELW